MKTVPAFVMPATLEIYREDTFYSCDALANIKQLLRGWVASPMVEFEGCAQSRLDIYDTVIKLVSVIECATTQSDEEIEEDIQDFVSFHADEKEALKNLRCVLQGYTGSVVVEQSGDGSKRAEVVDTYFEVEAIVKELFARK